MRAVVVGAGIGGLTAALMLRRAGLAVTVVEQAPALREVGAGIQLAPNATRLLRRLGVGDALERVAVRPAAIEHRRWQDGRVLLRTLLGETCERRFGAPYYHVYRPHLLDLLARALPDDAVQLGRCCAAIIQHADSVTVVFEDGTTASADLVVGADGIHSTLRAALHGRESPWFSGSIAYRGLVPAERIAHLDIARQSHSWLGPERHFVCYWVAAGRYLNFVAVVPARDWRVESWSATGDVAEAVADFEGWDKTVPAIIGAAERTHRWGLYDREPLESWSAGRVALLGDAAHAMLPFLAQGACQAIEDAAVLARCLQGIAPAAVPEALRRYEAIRKPRVWQVQRASRDNVVTYHLPDGQAQRERDARYAASMAASPWGARAWIYEYDAEEAASP
ncbi:MAG TPA: FAD-dependent monooxygenase [Methylomirabilota bacterium]|nr:FAD-dependent monooxygenase [Methylomirabilota bacterium]